MSQQRRPADVHGHFAALVTRRAARQIQFAQPVQLAHRLVQALEADALGHEAEVQDAQLRALAQTGPAVDGEGRLRGDEDLQRRLGTS